MKENNYRIGVDIGGTFTDLVLFDTEKGTLYNEKVLTTPDDPSQAVLAGISKILTQNHIKAAHIENVIHGTTLVANALIERKGVKTALVTTEGFRDVLEIGREWRYDLFDLTLEMPLPLVPRERRFELPERVRADGSIETPLDEKAAIELAKQLDQSDIVAVAIVFIHAYKNPIHEQQVKAIFKEHAPHLTLCLSYEVSPEIGEYERSSTVVANAYVQPIFKKYVQELGSGIRKMGIDHDLFLMLSDGGTVHQSAAIEYPIRLIQSGPAGGAQAATLYGKLAQRQNLLCFDMGGTTAKTCLIENGKPNRTTDFEVARVFRFAKGSGLPLQVPVVDMIEIGAGGGSIAQLNRMGLIQVGPESAGSKPGPACYGLGGELPTVTDADLILGYLDAGNFLGGDMLLDLDAAKMAVMRHIAEPLGLSVVEAAWGIHETVTENMAQAATIHALEKGRKVDSFTIIPIGGAGPVHVCSLANKMSIKQLICPLGAGVASALGLLASPTSFEFVQADLQSLEQLEFAKINQILAELEKRGRRLLAQSAVAKAEMQTSFSALMRYSGQGYEVEVPISDQIKTSASKEHLSKAFDKVYGDLYGRTESMPPEVISWRVVVSGPVPEVSLKNQESNLGNAEDALKNHRNAYFSESDGYTKTPVYDRYLLTPQAELSGPAIIEERESTLVVPPHFTVKVDPYGILMIEKQ